jgi:WD domain, G-beta repeat/PQQ-like domain
MRLLAALSLVAVSTTFAAPQKEQLPPGAIARLDATNGAKKDASATIHVLTFADERNLFIGSGSGWTTWDLEKRQPRQEKPVGGPALAIARHADRLYVGSSRTLHLIEPIQSVGAGAARSWASASETVNVLAVAPGGGRVVYSDGEQKLAVLDPRTGKPSGAVELASRPAAASLTANGRILAVVTRDGAVRVYDLAANGNVEPVWTKRVARADQIPAGFSPDGRLFAVSTAGRVMILDSISGMSMQRLERRFGEGDVRCLAFSPDGRLIAVGSAGPESVVRICDVVSAHEYVSQTGHAGDVNAVAFSPDGRTLASGGADGSVLLWKVPVPSPERELPTTADSWDKLDSLEPKVAFHAMGNLLAHPGRAVTVIGDGFRGMPAEETRIRRWVAELDHDEYRTREAARRNLLKTGLRGAAALTEPGRKRLGPEGEQRVRLILESLDSQGLHVPEGGLFGEPLRSVRGVRVLETIGGKAAREVLEETAKGPADLKLTKEAKLALTTFRDGP